MKKFYKEPQICGEYESEVSIKGMGEIIRKGSAPSGSEERGCRLASWITRVEKGCRAQKVKR